MVQFFTAAILILAANTAYQDFPRLASILARDRFMPSQFVNRGDRFVFSNGVDRPGAAVVAMIYAFHADLNTLIHFYVVGVFTSFTLSQTGMVRHWLVEGRKGAGAVRGWRRSIVINIIGAITTAVVLVVVVMSKFADGAWLSILIIGLLVPGFYSIHRHYAWVRLGAPRCGTAGRAGGEPHRAVGSRRRCIHRGGARLRALVPSGSLHAVTPGASVPADLAERWRPCGGGCRRAGGARNRQPHRQRSASSCGVCSPVLTTS